MHHPSPDIVAAYSAGTLEPGFGLVVAAHLEVCRECRAQKRRFEAVSGEALATLPETAMSDGALQRVLSQLDVQERPVERDDRPFLHRLKLKPRRWVAPGVWVAAVDTPHEPDNRVYVLSVAHRMPTARHAHSGAEFCTVLQGAFEDESGIYRAGDFAVADGSVNHQPIVVGDEACVCIFATEGRLQAQGLIGRIAFGVANV